MQDDENTGVKRRKAIMAAREFIDNMTDEQAEAVNHSGPPNLLLAGAGSGKTRTLVARMVHLIMPVKEGGFGAPPDSIMLATFTNKAAREIRERIAPILSSMNEAGLVDYGEPWCGTFHSLSLRLLRNQAMRGTLRDNFSIYDESDSKHLAREAFEHLDIERYDLDQFFSKLSTAKAYLLTPDFLADAMDSDDRDSMVLKSYFDPSFVKVYRQYQSFLEQQNAVDFSDLLSRTTETLRSDDHLCAAIRSHFRHFLIDEVQDIDRAQIGWLGALTDWGRPMNIEALEARFERRDDITPKLGEGVNWDRLTRFPRPEILSVGDDDQAIYSFRGSDSKSLKLLETRFKDTKVSFLTLSYRCQPNILDVTNAFVAENDGRYNKILRAPYKRDPEGPVKLKEFRTAQDEISSIASILKERLENEESISGHAILLRTRNIARNVARLLKEDGIPVTEGRGTDLRSAAEVKDAVAFATVLANPDSELSLRRIINKPSRGIGATSLARVKSNARIKDVAFIDELRSIMNDRIDVGEEGEGYPKRFVAALKDFGRLIVRCREQVDEAENAGDALTRVLEATGYLDDLRKTACSALGFKLEHIPEDARDPRRFVGWAVAEMQAAREHKQLRNKYRDPEDIEAGRKTIEKQRRETQESLLAADHDSLMSDAHMSSKALGHIGNLAVLIEKAEEFKTLPEWLETVSLDLDHSQTREGVQVMTMHAAKGLEFDMVHLPFWVDGVMPHSRSEKADGLKDGGGIEEERRLGYVSMTRARHECRISWYETRPDTAVFPSLARASIGASSFIEEINGMAQQPGMEGRLDIDMQPKRTVNHNRGADDIPHNDAEFHRIFLANRERSNTAMDGDEAPSPQKEDPTPCP